jgi:hypothetical protein
MHYPNCPNRDEAIEAIRPRLRNGSVSAGA